MVTSTVTKLSKTDLTNPTAPYVVGLDITTSGISVARLAAGNPRVRAEWVSAPSSAGKSHTVSSMLHRHTTVTRRVIDTITSIQGKRVRPSLVVMVKPHYKPINQDPSAVRRIGLWFQMAAELDRLGIATAEVPIYVISRWLMGGSGGRMSTSTFSQIGDAISAHFPGVVARPADPEVDTSSLSSYRMTTVAVAAAAAMAAGVETPVPVTQERLNTLSGYADPDARHKSDGSINFPFGRKPPRSVDVWTKRNADPALWLAKRNDDPAMATAEDEDSDQEGAA
ncbi:MAG: hypothetical protein KDB26_13955 [Microthrixaceae bacterium]|nr:hypothetical protein [Microthrixaceae bacterium]